MGNFQRLLFHPLHAELCFRPVLFTFRFTEIISLPWTYSLAAPYVFSCCFSIFLWIFLVSQQFFTIISGLCVACSDTLIRLSYKDARKVERSLKEPGRYGGNLRIQTGISMKTATETVQARTPDFTFPMLIFHGLADKITNPAISRGLFDRAASKDKTYITFPTAWHSLWYEPQETVDVLFDDMLTWLGARGLGSRGPLTVCEVIHHTDPEVVLVEPPAAAAAAAGAAAI